MPPPPPAPRTFLRKIPELKLEALSTPQGGGEIRPLWRAVRLLVCFPVAFAGGLVLLVGRRLLWVGHRGPRVGTRRFVLLF